MSTQDTSINAVQNAGDTAQTSAPVITGGAGGIATGMPVGTDATNAPVPVAAVLAADAAGADGAAATSTAPVAPAAPQPALTDDSVAVTLLREIKTDISALSTKIDDVQSQATRSGAIAGSAAGAVSGGIVALGMQFIRHKLGF
jgi:hypothetical protein